MNNYEMLKGAVSLLKPVDKKKIRSCNMRDEDANILRDFGLPIEKTLFNARFDDLNVTHNSSQVLSMVEAIEELGIPTTFFQSNQQNLNPVDLISLGTVYSDSAQANCAILYLHQVDGHLGWLYLPTRNTECDAIKVNENLTAYLVCMLAYNEYYRNRLELGRAYPNFMDSTYQRSAHELMNAFAASLERADRRSAEEGFWACVRADEELLLELNYSDDNEMDSTV